MTKAEQLDAMKQAIKDGLAIINGREYANEARDDVIEIVAKYYLFNNYWKDDVTPKDAMALYVLLAVSLEEDWLVTRQQFEETVRRWLFKFQC